MRRLRTTATLAVVLVGLLVPPRVPAAPKPADQNARQAKEVYDQGKREFGLGRYAEAAAAFEKAFELKSDPAFLFNAAQANRLGGNKPRALELYRNYRSLFGGRKDGVDVSDKIVELEKAIQVDQDAAAAAAARDSAAREAAARQVAGGSTGTEPAALVSTPAPASRPLTRRPWFWAVIGTAVVAAAVGVLVATRSRAPDASLGSVAAP